MFGRVVETRFDSKLLAGNVLGDPTERDVIVYLPPNYEDGRFPTITLLPGFAATHRSIVSWRPWQQNTLERFDAQVAAGESKPAILVLPDCVNRWGGSQFVDSKATGPYQSYLADEVFPHIDATFRTIPGRLGRGVIGRSSGGFGALRLGMDRPDAVSVVGSHAGDAAFDISMRSMLTNAAIGFEQAGGLEQFCKDVVRGGPKGASAFDAVFVLAASAAYAADMDAPFPHCALPFDARTAELREDIWALWKAQDPLERIAGREDALRSLSLVWLDSGNRDEHGLAFAARLMADRLREIGATVEHEEYDGGHRGTSWRYETSLPRFAEALHAQAD